MRHVIKPILITLGAAVAAFTVASSASFNGAPAAKAKTFCNGHSQTVPIQLVPILLPVLPTIPAPSTPSIPCIPVPTLPQQPSPTLPPVNGPSVSIPTIPTITIPTVRIPVIQLPTTTSTTWNCQVTAEAVVPSVC